MICYYRFGPGDSRILKSARNPRFQTRSRMPDLSTTIAGIHLKNPVFTASGTFGYGEEFAELIDLNALGGFVVKGLSIEPIQGSKPPRLHETPAGGKRLRISGKSSER